MRKLEIKIIVHEYDSVKDLNAEDQILVEKAIEAAGKAYAPYSGFKVGAALRLANGEIITGNNQENAAYPSGLCAERVALFYANAQYPDVPVNAIAITSFNNGQQVNETVYPCGSCRQVILEDEVRFENHVRMILAGKDKIIIAGNIKALLPLHFDKSALRE